MNKIELALMMFCIMGCAVTLEGTEAKTEQIHQAVALNPERQRRILTNIKTANGNPVERRLMNPYLMSSVYNSMMLNYMGFGMSPYTYSPHSMYHMGGMMNPMSSMMMNPMMMGMMNPMMMGMMNPMMMGMMNPMMMGMYPWMMMSQFNRNNSSNNGSSNNDNRNNNQPPAKKEARDEKTPEENSPNKRKLTDVSELTAFETQTSK